MKQITLYEDETLYVGCTLRDQSLPCEGSLALHTNDPAQDIRANRRRLSEQLSLSLSNWCVANQTHSANSYEVKNDDRGKGANDCESAIAQCDALYTKEKQLLLGVFTADCIPLLFYDPTSSYCGAIHSGWPGTVQQITTRTFQQVIQKGLCPATTKVWIAPCIHQPSFQIREDVITKIQKLPFDTAPYLQFLPDQSALCDHIGLNVEMLKALGVQESNIHRCEMDTFQEQADCFSYRRDHTSHRHFSFLYKK